MEFKDENFYTIDGISYPRVTHILDVGYAKGKRFQQWLIENGEQSEEIRDRAARSGTAVHVAIGLLLEKQKLVFGQTVTDFKGESFVLGEREWKKIMSFMMWYTDFAPDEVVYNEVLLCSKTYGYAGTCDFVVKKDGKTYLLDFKTGNGFHKVYWAQLGAYAAAYEEQGYGKIDVIGIIHLGTKHKKGYDFIATEGKKKRESKDITIKRAFSLFLAAQHIYECENPESTPRNRLYPRELSLDVPVDVQLAGADDEE